VVGLSRIYMGVHFPSDVVIGSLIGVLLAGAAWLINNKVPAVPFPLMLRDTR
jgi:membrane-associated phospholipid phosphatase